MILYAAPLLTTDECAVLRDAFERHLGESEERDFSGQPVVRWPRFNDSPAVYDLVFRCGERATTAITKTTTNEWFDRGMIRFLDMETTLLTRMGPGGWHTPHADNCKRDDNGNWVPNHTPHRTHTAIVYLSTPIEGGELYFPQHGVEIRPQTGHIVVFPADGEHEHGVREVKAGLRYSMAMWLTAKS